MYAFYINRFVFLSSVKECVTRYILKVPCYSTSMYTRYKL